MTKQSDMEILLVTIPGLERPLRAEAVEKGFRDADIIKGGVTIVGTWEDVWRANLQIRGASKILVRIGSFHAVHLAQLDKRARRFAWSETLRPDVPVRVEVATSKSRIYHQKAAIERIERALQEEMGVTISRDAEICIKVRIFQDLCTFSIDSSGAGLHIRGHKEALNKAPMRETMAALMLKICGFEGTEPVLDPMCGSGTFTLEAAEIATGLFPGRSRPFAFEKLATFNEKRWNKLKSITDTQTTETRFYGFDRDKGAISRANANATRANLEAITDFQQQTISELKAPEGPPGLVIINPPYGVRIGEVKKLFPLYQTLGDRLQKNFKGWRVGLVTNEHKLATSTKLPFNATVTPFSHGGIRVKLYTTGPLT
jgi:putative N6-adenine-specific DNA methylase